MIGPRYRGRQPANPAIDWSNPITQGLVALFVPGLSLNNLVTKNVRFPWTSRGTAASAIATPDGMGWDGTKQNQGVWCAAPSELQLNWPVTCWSRGVFGGNTQSNNPAILIGVSYTTSITSPFISYSVTMGSGTAAGSLPPGMSAGVSGAPGIGFANSATWSHVAANTAWTTGAVNDVVGVFDAAGPQLYVNGKLDKSGSAISNPTYSTPQLNLGIWSPDSASATRLASTMQSIAGIWNRVLRADEVATLWANPWALLLPTPRRIFDGFTAGAAVPYWAFVRNNSVVGVGVN